MHIYAILSSIFFFYCGFFVLLTAAMNGLVTRWHALTALGFLIASIGFGSL